ncbi:MAG TPA: hypothetical protein PKE26_11685 [Kiritimatiellia bacterium]|nr:hypothetical protein [Kiritimatiellia bacterium]HMO99761.1 hypothetical protein [Kiritimatiellia bacterium]HMP97366.1 hypothetical protein [Kiritimatiellia bacterium]
MKKFIKTVLSKMSGIGQERGSEAMGRCDDVITVDVASNDGKPAMNTEHSSDIYRHPISRRRIPRRVKGERAD